MGAREWLLGSACGVAVLAAASIGQGAGLQFEHVLNIGTGGTGDGQFKYAEDAAWDAAGNLLVTDATLANVQVFDRLTGKFLGKFGGKGDGPGQFQKPEGIAVDPDGNIYVADYMSGSIKKFDKSFKHLKTFSGYGRGDGENMESEFMSVGHGSLYMAEAGNHRVDVFDLNGQFKFSFGGKGTAPGQMQRPEAAKVHPNGNVYGSDHGHNRVQSTTTTGNVSRQWGQE